MGVIRNEKGNIIINVKDKVESFNYFFFIVDEKFVDVIILDNFFNIFYYIY